MEPALRNSPALINKIEKIRDDLIKRFESIVGLAGVEKNDRNTTALAQYQLHTETAALIRSAEELQALIRQLQEAWLFGQLNTMGENKALQQTEKDAKEVAILLKHLTRAQNNGDASAGGEGVPAEDVMTNDE